MSEVPPSPTLEADEVASLDGNRRLPGHARPVACALTLDFSAFAPEPPAEPHRSRPAAGEDHAAEQSTGLSAPRVRGRLWLDVALDRPDRHIVLHGEGLSWGPCVALLPNGEGHPERVVTLRPVTGTDGALALLAAELLPAGPLVLDLRWSCGVAQVPEGLYAVEVEGERYLFTQFEPLAARRMFPCFDEPAFKVPYTLTVQAPAAWTVLANSPGAPEASASSASSTQLEAPVAEMRTWRFEPTPPIASYVVALALGPFDMVSAPPSPGAVPLRVATTRGRGHLAAAALEATPPLLAALSGWCGQPYPYAKLDLVGVPDFAAGAMENVGLVTFRERLLLLDPDAAPVHDRMWAEIVIAHELAHMWFGNLVTPPWWDELWLNEAFATWLETWAMGQVSPAFGVDLEAARETDRVMAHDALAEARAVRQPILDAGDVLNAFDAITYGKGAALVGMVRAWLGAEAFDGAVRAWLSDHAHGIGTTESLLARLTARSGQPVAEVLGPFLDRPGCPWLVVTPEATDPRRLHLSVEAQARSADDEGEAAPLTAWTLPAHLRWADATGQEQVVSLLVGPAPQVLELPAAPRWVLPGHGGLAYHRWQLPTAWLTRLVAARSRLSPVEQVALPGHLWALVEARAVSAAVFCGWARALAPAAPQPVLGALIEAFDRLDLLPLSTRAAAALAATVAACLGPWAAIRGPWPRPDDTHADRLGRAEVLSALIRLTPAPALRTELASRLDPLLNDFAQADGEVASLVLPLGAMAVADDLAGDALVPRLLVALELAPTPAHRAAALTGLGNLARGVRATAIFERALGPNIRAQDLFSLLRPATRRAEDRARLWAWLDRRWTSVVEKAGPEAAAHLPRLGNRACTRAERDALTEFFAPADRRPPGADRVLRQVQATIDRNLQLADHAVPSLENAVVAGG